MTKEQVEARSSKVRKCPEYRRPRMTVVLCQQYNTENAKKWHVKQLNFQGRLY